MNDDTNRYVVRLRDGDYLQKVRAGEWDAVKVHFDFTPDRKKAKVLTGKEKERIWPEVVRGFSGPDLIVVGSPQDKATDDNDDNPFL